MLSKFYLNNNIFFKKIIIQKIFTKYVYTKFLIISVLKISKKKSTLILDNYFIELTFKLKKKFKRLKYLFKLKTGKYLKCNLFIYKLSKLITIYFLSARFNIYLKKKIYFSLNKLKFIIQQLNLVFIYKSTRGGFLGFSNNILGFFSKKYFLNLQYYLQENINLLIYKKYFIFLNILNCLPYKYTNLSSLYIYKAGYIRNFQKIKKKKTLRRFFFKRFKFFFLVPFFIFKKKIMYIKNNYINILKYKSSFLFNSLFKIFFLFLIKNKQNLFIKK